MERWLHKVLALLLILVVIFVSTALPIKASGFFHKRGPKGIRLLIIVNCFGGGVFFGAYLMHMTPEVKDLLNIAWLIPNNITFPMPELFMGVGFFLLMFVEKGVTTFMMRSAKNKDSKDAQEVYQRTVEIETGSDENVNCKSKPSDDLSDRLSTQKETRSIEEGPAISPDVNPDAVPQDLDNLPSLTPGAKGNTMQSLILLAALSLDCIFEGLSLGLQRTPNGVWNLVLAILSHEFVIAFTLGLELFKVNSARKTFYYAVFYALTCPVGITIGIIIMETGDPSPTIDIVSGIFQAMSAGVFIYCTFLEVLPGQIGHKTPLANILAVFVGFVFMALMALIPQPDEPLPGGPGPNPSEPPNGPPSLSHIPYLIQLLLPIHGEKNS